MSSQSPFRRNVVSRVLGISALISVLAAVGCASNKGGRTPSLAAPPASNWYVAKTGSDSNSGTSADPFLTIGHAAGVVNPGDTVIVESGIYQESLNLTRGGTSSAYVTFESQTPLGAVLDGNNNTLQEGVEFAANHITFKGFEVRSYGLAVGGGDGFSNFNGGQFIDIAQNFIHDIGRICTDTANGLPAIFLKAPNVTIEQNLIQDIGRYAPGENGCSPSTDNYKNHDHGVYVDAGSNNVTIKNNIFYRIERGWGIHVYPNGVDSLQILNNTFVWPNPYETGQIVFDISTVLTNLLVENNISHALTTSFIYNYSTPSGVTGTVANNLISTGTVFDTTPSGGVSVTGNILGVDPLLVNNGTPTMDAATPALNAYLQSSSPAINAGLTISGVTNDYAGTTRPQGAAYDIGAYEYFGTSVPIITTSLPNGTQFVPYCQTVMAAVSPLSYRAVSAFTDEHTLGCPKNFGQVPRSPLIVIWPLLDSHMTIVQFLRTWAPGLLGLPKPFGLLSGQSERTYPSCRTSIPLELC
jgi:hypothetical protein